MNPASDVGKRDIPVGIRNRFTELFVDECDDRSDIVIIVDKYLNQTNIPREYIDRIVNFYIDIQMKVKHFLLTSSSTTNNRIAVNYRLEFYSFNFLESFLFLFSSLRTLCRALKYVATTQWSGKSYSRSLFEVEILNFSKIL
jgi:midasin